MIKSQGIIRMMGSSHQGRHPHPHPLHPRRRAGSCFCPSPACAIAAIPAAIICASREFKIHPLNGQHCATSCWLRRRISPPRGSDLDSAWPLPLTTTNTTNKIGINEKARSTRKAYRAGVPVRVRI